MIGLSSALIAQEDVAASSSLNQAEAARQQLGIDLLAANAAGYLQSDLQPILDRQDELAMTAAPAWPSADRTTYFRAQATALAALRFDLAELEVHQLDLLRRVTGTRLSDLNAQLADDARLGVEAETLAPLREAAAGMGLVLDHARSPLDYRRAFSDLGGTIDAAEQLRLARSADLAAVQAEADHLRTLSGGNLPGLRELGRQALAEGRNYASAAAYLRSPIGRHYEALEAEGRKLVADNLDDLAGAVALIERYRDQIHGELIARFPHKLILVSIIASQMWVYEDGKLFLNTLVTTGRPELPTDRGLMRVARKESPVHFISPFPKGSTFDYGTIDARYALWFQPSGEAIHDSWWRSWYGPGSNIGDHGSHGCIGLPYGPIDALFPWTDVGTPVLVIPGDGQPADVQMAEKTYDDPLWGDGPIV